MEQEFSWSRLLRPCGCTECRDRERANVMRALEISEGRVYGRSGAAELLGINPTTLASRLRALKIAAAKAR